MRAALSVARRAISRALAITPAATATRAAVAEGNLTILAGASRAASTYATGFAGSAAFAPAALRGATIFSTIAAAAGAGAAYVAYENVPVAEAKAASPKVRKTP